MRSVGIERGSTNAQLLNNLMGRISKNQQPGNLQLPGTQLCGVGLLPHSVANNPARLNPSRSPDPFGEFYPKKQKAG